MMKSSVTSVIKSNFPYSFSVALLLLAYLLLGRQLADQSYLSAVLYAVGILAVSLLGLNAFWLMRKMSLGTEDGLRGEVVGSRTEPLETTKASADGLQLAESAPEDEAGGRAALEEESPTFRSMDDFSVMDGIPIGIIMLDMEGKIRYLNERAQEIVEKLSQWLPLNVQQIKGTSYYEFYQDADVQKPLFRDPGNLPVQADLTVGSEIIETNSIAIYDMGGDYVGPMVTWKFVTYERNQSRWNQVVEEQIQNASHHLTNTSRDLQKIYQQMKSLAEQTVGGAKNVSNFALQTSEQINQIAVAVQQTSETIRTTAEKVNHSSSIAQQALKETQNASEIVSELSNMSTQIRNMVQMIEQIMEQTRMLALNATIEAVGAGSAGVGFKVIADEVRDISRQTTEVAGEIIGMIGQMLKKIPLSVQSMQTVQNVIHQMNEITLSIDEEMQNQTDNINTVNNNMNEADENSRQIVSRMEAIESQSRETQEHVGKGFETTNEIEEIDKTFRIISKRFGEDRIVTPNDIYRLNGIIRRMFEALLERRDPTAHGKAMELTLSEFTGKKPADVLGKSMSAAKEFLKRMDLPEEQIDFPKGLVTPTQTYNFLVQFMELVEKTLVEEGVPDVAELKMAKPEDGKSPDDAFGMIELASRKLSFL
ncbi:MAG: hypothetical protein GY866_22755 [Proteobacteria bacterium]|nr:hypothetical protein [Pseudomonadota bacterium]